MWLGSLIGWDKPILTEPNFDGGILGLLRKRINGVPLYLVNVKFEPGNYRLFHNYFDTKHKKTFKRNQSRL